MNTGNDLQYDLSTALDMIKTSCDAVERNKEVEYIASPLLYACQIIEDVLEKMDVH